MKTLFIKTSDPYLLKQFQCFGIPVMREGDQIIGFLPPSFFAGINNQRLVSKRLKRWTKNMDPNVVLTLGEWQPLNVFWEKAIPSPLLANLIKIYDR